MGSAHPPQLVIEWVLPLEVLFGGLPGMQGHSAGISFAGLLLLYTPFHSGVMD